MSFGFSNIEKIELPAVNTQSVNLIFQTEKLKTGLVFVM